VTIACSLLQSLILSVRERERGGAGGGLGPGGERGLAAPGWKLAFISGGSGLETGGGRLEVVSGIPLPLPLASGRGRGLALAVALALAAHAHALAHTLAPFGSW
jgi:hypothetical protein